MFSTFQLKDLREAFAMFDKNGDGNISAQELETVRTSPFFRVFQTQKKKKKTVNQYRNKLIPSLCENVQVMSSFGHKLSKAEVQDMINEVDVDGNGTIEFNEFVVMMNRKMELRETESEMREAFKVFDRNGDGKISPQELKQVSTSHTHIRKK
jgi:calmodulin